MERTGLSAKLSPYSGKAMPLLLGIIGPKGSGKSSLARAIQSCLNNPSMAHRMRFAGPIKRMVGQLLMEAGVEPVDEFIDGSRKEEELAPFPVEGITSRSLMQTLGTEWGREVVGEDIWLGLTINKARKARSMGKIAMIDDVRFPNEVKAVRWHGGSIIRVQRDGCSWDGADAHASEGAIASVIPEWFVDNNGSLDDLETTADALLANISLKRKAQ